MSRRKFFGRFGKLAGAGAVGAALMGIGDRSILAAPPSTAQAYLDNWAQEAAVNVLVWADSGGAYYVKDTGIGSSVGQEIVSANVITAYGQGLGAGTAGASTTTAGIQEAVNCLRGTGGAGGGKIALQGGTNYKTTSTINLYPGMALVGIGASGDFVYGNCSIVPGATMNTPVIQVIADPNNLTLVSFPSVNNLTINSANPVETAQDGIYISDANANLLDVYLDTVGIFGMGGTGVNDQSGTKLWMENMYFEACSQHGLYVNNASANVRLGRFYCYGNTLTGLNFNAFNYVNVDHGEVWNNVQYGVNANLNIATPALFDDVYLANNGSSVYEAFNANVLNNMTYGCLLMHGLQLIDNRGVGSTAHLIGIDGSKTLNWIMENCSLYNIHGSALSNLVLFGSTSLNTGFVKWANCVGLTPVGVITNPFNAAAIGPGIGTAAIPTASTAYLVMATDIKITAANSANANNAISITDYWGNTVVSGLSTLSREFVARGSKINWGAFTGVAGAVTIEGVSS